MFFFLNVSVMCTERGIEQRPKTFWAAVRSRLGDGLIGSQRCCYETRSGEYMPSSHSLIIIARLVTNRVLRIWVVEGIENEADIGTKPPSGDMLDRILKSLNSRLEFVSRL